MKTKQNSDQKIGLIILVVIVLMMGLAFIVNVYSDNKNNTPISANVSTTPVRREISEDNFKFKSNSYDVEKPVNVINSTLKDITYHTFDFANRVVTFNGVKSNGETFSKTYTMKSFYKESGLLGETYVMVVNENGVKEIWFSVEGNNLGYDLEDGSRLAFYDIVRLNQ